MVEVGAGMVMVVVVGGRKDPSGQILVAMAASASLPRYVSSLNK
jgi:hypothetical protein